MSTFNTLTIRSTNPDANGTWNRKDVEQELRELGYGSMIYSEWIEYILTHTIDDAFDSDMFNLIHEIVENDQILEIKIKSNNGDVYTISKK